MKRIQIYVSEMFFLNIYGINENDNENVNILKIAFMRKKQQKQYLIENQYENITP